MHDSSLILSYLVIGVAIVVIVFACRSIYIRRSINKRNQ